MECFKAPLLLKQVIVDENGTYDGDRRHEQDPQGVKFSHCASLLHFARRIPYLRPLHLAARHRTAYPQLNNARLYVAALFLCEYLFAGRDLEPAGGMGGMGDMDY
jgi:hypothetical protein